VRLTATSSAWHLRQIIFGALAVVLAVAAVIVWRRSRKQKRISVTPSP